MIAPLPEVTDHATDTELCVGVQYMPPRGGGQLPIIVQHAETFIQRGGTVLDAVSRLEHSGCSSGRLLCLFAVVREGHPSNSITPRPTDLGPPDQPWDDSPPAAGRRNKSPSSISVPVSQVLELPPSEEPDTDGSALIAPDPADDVVSAGDAAVGVSVAPLTSAESVALVDRVFSRRPGDPEGSDASPTSPMSEASEIPEGLTSEERSTLQALALQIHRRIGDWQTVLRHLATEVSVLQPVVQPHEDATEVSIAQPHEDEFLTD